MYEVRGCTFTESQCAWKIYFQLPSLQRKGAPCPVPVKPSARCRIGFPSYFFHGPSGCPKWRSPHRSSCFQSDWPNKPGNIHPLSSRRKDLRQPGGLVLRKLPRLSHLNALRQRFLLNAGQIIVHLCHPNNVAICKTHEIKVRRTVIINE